MIGLILLICLVLHLMGGFRTQSKPSAAALSRDIRSGVRSGVSTQQ
jgi:hypothetical protein